MRRRLWKKKRLCVECVNVSVCVLWSKCVYVCESLSCRVCRCVCVSWNKCVCVCVRANVTRVRVMM
jgi:hypothetical protein